MLCTSQTKKKGKLQTSKCLSRTRVLLKLSFFFFPPPPNPTPTRPSHMIFFFPYWTRSLHVADVNIATTLLGWADLGVNLLASLLSLSSLSGSPLSTVACWTIRNINSVTLCNPRFVFIKSWTGGEWVVEAQKQTFRSAKTAWFGHWERGSVCMCCSHKLWRAKRENLHFVWILA